MADKDIISIEYFEDNERFADLLNGYLFEGRKIVRPEDLQEADRSVSRIQKTPGCRNVQAMVRDVVKLLQVHMKIMLVVMENQSSIHYAMPVRVMNEEAAGYHKQWRETARKHRREKDLSDEEYLSGFSRDDRLMPMITIVLYFGERPWDGAKSLKGMLDMRGIPRNLQDMVADYPIHVLEVRKFENAEYFQTDLQVVFGFLQNSESQEKLKKYVDAHSRQFENLDPDTYNLISVMSHSSELKTVKQNNTTAIGGINMCKAIRDMIQEGEKRGIILAKKIYQLKARGMDKAAIAKECNVSIEKVLEILEDSME